MEFILGDLLLATIFLQANTIYIRSQILARVRTCLSVLSSIYVIVEMSYDGLLQYTCGGVLSCFVYVVDAAHLCINLNNLY